jgi:anaerobic selenocysteine-containing dehydrogenase
MPGPESGRLAQDGIRCRRVHEGLDHPHQGERARVGAVVVRGRLGRFGGQPQTGALRQGKGTGHHDRAHPDRRLGKPHHIGRPARGGRCDGFEAWRDHLAALDWDQVLDATGLTRAQIQDAAALFAASSKTVVCWAMGITQHKNAVATIKEIVNVTLLQGNIGKPGAGLCPVRGHSNVQGDRTMGIWEKLPTHFGDALREEFGFEPPRRRGLDVVDSIRAMRDGIAGSSSASAATSSPRPRTPTSPRPPCAAAT